MALSNFGHSAHYTYLDEALRAQWDSYKALAAEMSAFVPRPKEDYQPARDAEIQRLRDLNPNTPLDQLIEFVEDQFAITSSEWWQFHSRFDQRHITGYITVVMLAHALCEALINAILAIGLAHVEAVELFAILEKTDFKQKWLTGPKSFAPTYRFPVGTALHEALVTLAKQRNAIVHMKIDIEVGGSKLIEGSEFDRKAYPEEQRWLARFFSLPYDLAEFARQAIPTAPIMLLWGRGPIARANEHAPE